jgi:hypothetical protein
MKIQKKRFSFEFHRAFPLMLPLLLLPLPLSVVVVVLVVVDLSDMYVREKCLDPRDRLKHQDGVYSSQFILFSATVVVVRTRRMRWSGREYAWGRSSSSHKTRIEEKPIS